MKSILYVNIDVDITHYLDSSLNSIKCDLDFNTHTQKMSHEQPYRYIKNIIANITC